MLWDIFTLLAGAVVGAGVTWIFEWHSGKQDKARHLETLQQYERSQQRVVELERSLQEMQHRMNEGFATTARPSETNTRPHSLVLDPQAVLAELRARLDVTGQASLGSVRAVFLGEGHSSQAFNQTLEQLVQAGAVRLNGKALELV